MPSTIGCPAPFSPLARISQLPSKPGIATGFGISAIWARFGGVPVSLNCAIHERWANGPMSELAGREPAFGAGFVNAISTSPGPATTIGVGSAISVN